MGKLVKQDDILQQLDELKRQVKELSRGPRLANVGAAASAPDATLIGPANALNSVTTYQFYDTYDVTVGTSGKLLIFMRAFIDLSATPGGTCQMGYKLTGANTKSASNQDCWTITTTANLQITAQFDDYLTGLNPGLTTITNCFKTGGSNIAQFQDRYIWAIPL